MISIALCTYNGEQYIKEQLESIIHQTLPPDEIVICDDCSKDHTEAEVKSVLRSWNGSWTFIVNDKNLGFRKNFEKAISLCKGDIIFLSDQDDVWLPEKIKKIMGIFCENPDCIMVFHDAIIVDANLNVLFNSFWKILGFDFNKFFNGDYGVLVNHNVVQGSACAFRKSLFIKASPFPQSAVHDEWLALNALIQQKSIIPVNEGLLLYRQSGRNVIGAGEFSFIDKLRKWGISLHIALNMYYEDLNRKKDNFRILRERYGNDCFLYGCNLTELIEFYELRINCLKNHKINFLLFPFRYIKYYDGIIYAFKCYIKDFMVLIFGFKRS